MKLLLTTLAIVYLSLFMSLQAQEQDLPFEEQLSSA